MSRHHILMLAFAASLSFSFAACGGKGSSDLASDCIDCGGYGGGAVRCWFPLGDFQDICGPDQSLAATTCLEAGGTWQGMELCGLGETGDGPGNLVWNPDRDVTFDPETGSYVVDQLAFDTLKTNPTALLDDTSQLREVEGGYFMVAASGDLAEALGWQTGDILLAVNDYPLAGMSEFAEAYRTLSNESIFELLILRGRSEIVLVYRVE